MGSENGGPLGVLWDMIALVAYLAYLIIPFSIPVWTLTVQVVPEATLLQQAFLFMIVSIVLILTGIGAFLVWMIGIVFISVWIIVQIWLFLG